MYTPTYAAAESWARASRRGVRWHRPCRTQKHTVRAAHRPALPHINTHGAPASGRDHHGPEWLMEDVEGGLIEHGDGSRLKA